jgi:hypothetical protein
LRLEPSQQSSQELRAAVTRLALRPDSVGRDATSVLAAFDAAKKVSDDYARAAAERRAARKTR